MIVKHGFVSELSAVFGNNFPFKASGSHLTYVAEQVKALCLLANSLDTPSYHLSLNDSDEMERIKIRDDQR